jgi:hypothetical protein
MEMKIGVVYTPREIELEVDDAATVIADTERMLTDGSRLITFTDRNGKRVLVVADKLAYIEFEGDDKEKRVGFGS